MNAKKKKKRPKKKGHHLQNVKPFSPLQNVKPFSPLPNVKPPIPLIQETSFSGPLPPPSVLEKYNDILSGGADRIITMAEIQSAHRIDIESKVINSDVFNSRLGIVCGLIIGMTGIICGSVCIIQGHPITGTILGSSSIGGLVGTFVYGSKSRRDERHNKDR